MTDVRVNNISVTFKVTYVGAEVTAVSESTPKTLGPVWTKWLSARLEGKAHSNFISEVAQM